jgi:hypothetical protein
MRLLAALVLTVVLARPVAPAAIEPPRIHWAPFCDDPHFAPPGWCVQEPSPC